MELTCPGCGHQNLEGADHCEECMSPLTHDDIPKPTMGLQEQILGKTIRDLNPLTPVMVPPITPIREAVGKMLKRNVSCCLVVEQNRLLGIMTERDVLMRVVGTDVNPDVASISSIMVKNPVVLNEEDSIAFALNKMSVGRYRHLPFLTRKVPTGFISIKTILRFLCRNL